MERTLIKKNLLSRNISYKIIKESEKSNKQLSLIINKYFNLNESLLKNIDKRFITMLVQGTVRLSGRLDWMLRKVYHGNFNKLRTDLKILLRIGSYQVLYMDKIPNHAAVGTTVELTKMIHKNFASLSNAILRSLIRSSDFIIPEKNSSIFEISEYLSHPEWLIKKWINDKGFYETLKISEWNNQIPLFWFRVNKNLYDIDSFKSYLERMNIEYEQFLDMKEYFKISKHQDIINSEIFKKGYLYVQDPSAGLVVRLLNPKPGDIVTDACAAPGGKTSYISEILNNKSKIFSHDSNVLRFNQLENNLLRLNTKNVSSKLIDVSTSHLEMSDKILLDVPCSGTGVISKKPDIRWRRSENEISEMNILQMQILCNASKYINPGGVIVYSTCSIEPEENDMIIDSFLENHKSFTLEAADLYISKKFTDKIGYLRTNSFYHKIDGGFAARLKYNA